MNPSERTCLNYWMPKEALEKVSIKFYRDHGI
jgi:hypothetical protein